MSIAYFDTSAIIKLIRIEAASESLRRWLEAPQRSEMIWVSSALVLTEVPRALRRIAGGSPLIDFSPVIDRLTLRVLDTDTLTRAGEYEDPHLRSLDAIHLATAHGLADAVGDGFEALVTYDARLAAAATACGVRVAMPS